MAIVWRYLPWETQNRTYSTGDQRLIGGASFREGLAYIEAGGADCGQYAAGGAVGPYDVGSMNDAGAQQPLAIRGPSAFDPNHRWFGIFFRGFAPPTGAQGVNFWDPATGGFHYGRLEDDNTISMTDA